MNWTRGHIIGQGASASVSIAVSHGSGEIFAVKSAGFSKSESLQREQKIMASLDFPHVVSYKGYCITRENSELVFNVTMEYVEGTLADAIRSHGGRLNESMISCYTKQIVEGLEYLHSRGIVHCDVKGSNILLAESGVIKISDFGCSKRLNSGDEEFETYEIGGTPMYMAPEVARGEEQGFAADIWALGCTIIEMATGGSPWTNVATPASALYKIAFSGEVPNFPEFLSDKAKDFLNMCLRRDPNHRWTAKRLLTHPFLEGSNSNAKIPQESYSNSSPTSILDKVIWNSLEEFESSVEIIETRLSNSPCQRMKTVALSSGKENWTWDETWITVRNSDDQGDREEDIVVFGSTAALTNHESRLSCENLINSVVVGYVSCSKDRDSNFLMTLASSVE